MCREKFQFVFTSEMCMRSYRWRLTSWFFDAIHLKKKWYFLIPQFFRTTSTRLWKSWVRLAGRNMHMDIPLCVPVGRRRLKLGNRKWLVGLANQAGRSRPTSPVIVGSGVLLCWPCSGASYWQLFGAIVWPSDVAKFRNLMYNFVAF